MQRRGTGITEKKEGGGFGRPETESPETETET